MLRLPLTAIESKIQLFDQEDQRQIFIYNLDNVIIASDAEHYPNIAIKSNNKIYNPLEESIMSLSERLANSIYTKIVAYYFCILHFIKKEEEHEKFNYKYLCQLIYHSLLSRLLQNLSRVVVGQTTTIIIAITPF